MGTIVVTGSASGIGAATAARLTSAGHTVLGVDRHDATIVADLASTAGRAEAMAAITAEVGGRLDGLVTCAGLGGLPGRPASLLVAVNYFGTVNLLQGLRPLLAATQGAAVAISSNSTTLQPGVPMDLVDACLTGDEEHARAVADAGDAFGAYPATKIAVARWVRRHAVKADWAGAGIRLNAIAPGMIDTAMVAELRADPMLGQALDAFPIPVGRPGRPDEIAGLIEFLLGPQAAFCCGSVIFFDGGSDALVRPDAWPSPLSAPF